MIGAVAVASLLLVGVPWPFVAAAALAVVSPVVGLIAFAAVAAVSLARRGRGAATSSAGEVEFLRHVTTSMVSGSTFRAALATSGGTIVDERTSRMCMVGVPLDVIVPGVVEHLPETGSAFAVLAEASESAGSSVVEACHVLVEEAEAVRRHKGELKVATAQARFSAVVVGVVPLLLALGFVAVRGIPEPGGPATVFPMAIGAALMLAGTAYVLVSSQRASS